MPGTLWAPKGVPGDARAPPFLDSGSLRGISYANFDPLDTQNDFKSPKKQSIRGSWLLQTAAGDLGWSGCLFLRHRPGDLFWLASIVVHPVFSKQASCQVRLRLKSGALWVPFISEKLQIQVSQARPILGKCVSSV